MAKGKKVLKGEFKNTDTEEATEEPKPRRYEVRDAETGEKLSGVSFILTPTGEEMHLLTAKGKSAGAMKDIGVYYHGELHDGLTGATSLPSVTPIALEYMAWEIFEQLATGLHPRRQKGGVRMLKYLGKRALKLYERHAAAHGLEEEEG